MRKQDCAGTAAISWGHKTVTASLPWQGTASGPMDNVLSIQTFVRRAMMHVPPLTILTDYAKETFTVTVYPTSTPYLAMTITLKSNAVCLRVTAYGLTQRKNARNRTWQQIAAT